MIKYRTLDDHDFSKDRVLLRLDLNLPTHNGAISDPTRLTKAIPTIARLASQGAKVIIISHFGRPKGINKSKLTGEIVFPKAGTIIFTDVDTHAVIDVCKDYNEPPNGVTYDQPLLGSKEI